jgi:hypothetical protein
MPKNQFQRPLPVRHTHNVPRHGAPLPKRMPEVRKPILPQQAQPPLPSLEALLAKTTIK